MIPNLFNINIKRIVLLAFVFHLNLSVLNGQSVNFALKVSPSINFSFDTVEKYQTGITRMNACELNVEVVGAQWDLYVGATSIVPGFWDVVSTYSTTGSPPPISILELQFRNSSGTSQIAGFFPIQDILTPNYIIGSAAAPDIAIGCPNNGTNAAGSYLVNPNCYRFNIDLRLNPGFSYQAGLYTLRVDYVLIEDL